MSATRREHGSASIYVLWVGLVVLVTAGILGSAGVAGVARARAASIADLAALAGAAADARGEPACRRAAALVRRGPASLVSCRVDGGVVTVDVRLPLRGVLARFGATTARSRAGPAVPQASSEPSPRVRRR
ncbi:MAG TPA: Rv3654c family TadE-like protein [Mycobacteriales bacterium]|nr:Rv3654c family TadE-like protein [Mycobacteriales bacterium]